MCGRSMPWINFVTVKVVSSASRAYFVTIDLPVVVQRHARSAASSSSACGRQASLMSTYSPRAPHRDCLLDVRTAYTASLLILCHQSSDDWPAQFYVSGHSFTWQAIVRDLGIFLDSGLWTVHNWISQIVWRSFGSPW